MILLPTNFLWFNSSTTIQVDAERASSSARETFFRSSLQARERGDAGAGFPVIQRRGRGGREARRSSQAATTA